MGQDPRELTGGGHRDPKSVLGLHEAGVQKPQGRQLQGIGTQAKGKGQKDGHLRGPTKEGSQGRAGKGD